MCFRNTTIYFRIDITVQNVIFYRAVHFETTTWTINLLKGVQISILSLLWALFTMIHHYGSLKIQLILLLKCFIVFLVNLYIAAKSLNLESNGFILVRMNCATVERGKKNKKTRRLKSFASIWSSLQIKARRLFMTAARNTQLLSTPAVLFHPHKPPPFCEPGELVSHIILS